MELGFSLNAGPLSQISMHIMSLDTAVHLAIGTYGWWKAKERTTTLIQLCALRQGQLVPSSTFQRDVYVERRHGHTVVGSVAQNGILNRVLLPKASTAVSNHPGETCLRALITALLCFYTVDATHEILKQVIPACLIHLDYDQNDVDNDEEPPFSMDGPLEYSLKATVQCIAAEEDCNTLRKKLLQVATEAENSCFQNVGTSRIRQNVSYAESDAGLAVGLVKWVTTSYLKREYSTYVTRSLNLLALAAVLKYLGFQVNTSSKLICSDDDAVSFYTDALKKESPWGQVALNISDTGATDIHKSRSPMPRQGVDSAAKAHVVPIASIPALAYKHARQSKYASTQELTDVFLFAFRETTRMKYKILLQDGRPRLHLEVPESPPNRFHEQLLRNWSPHVTKIILSFMGQYVPVKADNHAWNLDEIQEAFDLSLTRRLEAGDYFNTFASYDSPALASFSVIHSLVLGTAYGIAWPFIRDGVEQVPELSPVVFLPAVAIPYNLRDIVHNLGQILSGNNTINHLCGILSILLLGRTASPQGQGSMIANLFDDRRLILGMQGNGMHLICQYALRPSLHANRLCHFHMGEGQILNLPLTQENSIAMHEHDWPREPIQAGVPMKSSFQPYENDPVWSTGNYRLDLEPLWEKDPREAIFRLRYNGVEQFPINPAMLQDRLFNMSYGGECTCAGISPIQTDGTWKKLSLAAVFDNPVQASLTMRTWGREIGSRDAVLLDATNSTALQVALLGKIQSDYTLVHVNCERCTQSALEMANPQNQSILVILGSPPPLPSRPKNLVTVNEKT